MQKATMTHGARIVVVVAWDDPEDADDDDGSVDDTSFLEQLGTVGICINCFPILAVL
jgi:hypothetical protein